MLVTTTASSEPSDYPGVTVRLHPRSNLFYLPAAEARGAAEIKDCQGTRLCESRAGAAQGQQRTAGSRDDQCRHSYRISHQFPRTSMDKRDHDFSRKHPVQLLRQIIHWLLLLHSCGQNLKDSALVSIWIDSLMWFIWKIGMYAPFFISDCG